MAAKKIKAATKKVGAPHTNGKKAKVAQAAAVPAPAATASELDDPASDPAGSDDEEEEEEVADYSALATAAEGKKKPQRESTGPKATLFLRGLPYTTANADLEAYCSQIGPVKWCFVVADKSACDIGSENGLVAVAANQIARARSCDPPCR